jgi:exonuclease III
MVKEKGPDLVFLMETKMQNKKCDFIRIKLGFDYMFGVDSLGRSGGLLLLWKKNFNVTIQNYSRRHINAEINNCANNLKWKLTGFYGHPNSAKRKESWDLLRYLSNLQPSPWVCIGDFNEIVDSSEKKGVVIRPRWQMEDFQRGLEDARLHDLGFNGPKYTWNNGRPGRDYTVERLDRAVANTEWRDIWRDAGVEILVCCSSDHLPVLLKLQRLISHGRKKWRPFRYKVGWSKRGDFKKIIQEAWEVKIPSREPWVGFKRKLQKCKKVIQRWVQKSKPPTEKYIKEKTTELAKIQEEANPMKAHEEKELREEIQTLLE